MQLAECDQVAAIIGTITRRRAEINDAVTSVVHDSAVAALLVAKMSLAAERGVTIELAAGTELPTLDPDLSADVGTVLGNLIDNAVDATVAAGGERIDVWLRIEDGAVAVHNLHGAVFTAVLPMATRVSARRDLEYLVER